MTEENPFKKITPELKLPETLKEDILQEIKEYTEDSQDTDSSLESQDI
ncbi:hypothetical protein U8527_21585 [Kordia algicida OT-1]|uniref:Uncharacterized protein n=1 Tax=Kordia algicida OT-1 TaxID=391587 RepID=A9DQ37_9FLAO|nr:hypothetical protein [Kordia algicida]EDP96564.1 hypothetical protein KAOT1_15413 [Kordia algicida OT-1]